MDPMPLYAPDTPADIAPGMAGVHWVRGVPVAITAAEAAAAAAKSVRTHELGHRSLAAGALSTAPRVAAMAVLVPVRVIAGEALAGALSTLAHSHGQLSQQRQPPALAAKSVSRHKTEAEAQAEAQARAEAQTEETLATARHRAPSAKRSRPEPLALHSLEDATLTAGCERPPPEVPAAAAAVAAAAANTLGAAAAPTPLLFCSHWQSSRGAQPGPTQQTPLRKPWPDGAATPGASANEGGDSLGDHDIVRVQS